MDANMGWMARLWTCISPFVDLPTQIKEGIAYNKSVRNNMSDKNIFRITFKLITNTKHLNHLCAEWINKPTIDKYLGGGGQ